MSEVNKKKSSSCKSLMEKSFGSIQDLVQYMKTQGVSKFSYFELCVEFEIGPKISQMPQTLDDEQERADHIKNLLKEELANEDADLRWSSAP